MAAPDPPSPGGTGEPAERRSRAGLTTVCAAGLLVIAALQLSGHGSDAGTSDRAPQPPAAAQAALPSAGAPAAPADPEAGKHLPRSAPVRLLIPKISVDAPFTTLSLGPTGQLQPPPAADTNLVGWYAGGASPGETGTAIVAGHVDTATSAAVFARLDELRAGDVFRIQRADGRTASFVVDDTETFDKDSFPDERVYADAPRAEVRLITCAGDYDRSVRDYTENLVVFAHLV
ncbi:class F sortase [Streptomyces griseosporeus]|uniref:class F sortase n=1 Tax=Streptomyces griseosporeus TaxID=1910 RepID=UPI0036F55154